MTSPAATAAPRYFTAGTLRYTKAALVMLFFYLLWNDMILMLMEAVPGNLVPLLQKHFGASNLEISFYGSLTQACTFWLNPVVSTWSDRHRGRFGRRRPFLLAAALPCAIFLMLIPFAPQMFHAIQAWPWAARFFARGSINGVVLFIGLCVLGFQVFNSVILAVFNYFFSLLSGCSMNREAFCFDNQ